MTGTTVAGQSSSPAIIFLHGGVINRYMWGPVIDRLEAEHRCIAIDLPGHGDRKKEPFGIESSVLTVIETMDELSVDRATFVGLSLGGYVAQAAAAEHPDRVLGLVLSGATIRYTGWDGVSTRMFGYLFPVFAKPAMKSFASKMTKDLGQDLADQIIVGGLSARGGGQALRRLPGTDYAAEMEGFRGPIVLANGERDTGNRDGEAYFLSRFPEAESIVIEDAGHACALQQPDAFAEAVRHVVRLTFPRPIGS